MRRKEVDDLKNWKTWRISMRGESFSLTNLQNTCSEACVLVCLHLSLGQLFVSHLYFNCSASLCLNASILRGFLSYTTLVLTSSLISRWTIASSDPSNTRLSKLSSIILARDGQTCGALAFSIMIGVASSSISEGAGTSSTMLSCCLFTHL